MRHKSDKLLGFKWATCQEGFEVVEGKSRKTKGRARSLFLYALGSTLVEYPPLEKQDKMPILFQEFALLAPTPDKIIQFANKYGFLGGEFYGAIDSTDSSALFGESITSWQKEIINFRTVYKIWSLLNNKNLRELKTYIVCDDERITLNIPTSFRTEIYRETGEFPSQNYLLSKWVDARDYPKVLLSRAARILLSEIVSDRLKGLVYPVVQVDSKSKATLQFMPHNLQGAMWLQFAQVLDGTGEYKKCSMCPYWFRTGKNYGRRSDATVCSERCQKRRERAGLSKKTRA